MMDVKSFTISSRYIRDGEVRLNASSYSPEALKAIEFINELRRKNVEILKIENFAKNIFYPPRFKRIYSKRSGVPFLSSREIFDLVPKGKRVANLNKEYLIQSHWILITRSGTVGRVLISNKTLNNVGVSEHVIRIIPKKEVQIGYIYAYLSTWIGQAFLTKNIFGGVVDEIEPEHVANIPIPRIPEIEKEIHEKIMKAHEMIEKAQELLLEAERMIYTELGLPEIDEDKVEYFGDEDGRIVKAFTISSRELNYRLNALYYNPISKFAEDTLRKREDVKKLGNISKTFTPPRFKRFYVKDPKIGLPLLQGSHVPLIKPFDIKLIWKYMKNIEKYIIRNGWILVTCSGTVGKVSLVRDLWDSWVATNHITRIIPTELNCGYLTSYLLSEYGQIQFERLTYGGVVDEIGEAGELFNDILVPIPPKDIQDEIGNRVIQAYDLRDLAIKIEEEAVMQLEQKISELAGDTLS